VTPKPAAGAPDHTGSVRKRHSTGARIGVAHPREEEQTAARVGGIPRVYDTAGKCAGTWSRAAWEGVASRPTRAGRGSARSAYRRSYTVVRPFSSKANTV
jgi:hypothetical protein